MGQLLSAQAELTGANITDATIFYAVKSSADYKVQMSSLWTYVSTKCAASTVTFTRVDTSTAYIGGTTTEYVGGVCFLRGAMHATLPYLLHQICVSSTDAQAADVGGGITFGGKYNDAGAYTQFGSVYCHKENGVTGQTGAYMGFHIRANGTSNGERVRITSTGNLIIGTTACGTSAANTIGLYNGTAPSTSPANMIQLYATSGELRVRDSSNNITPLSPHNFTLFEPIADDPIPWSYYSENPYLGKIVNADLSGALRELEKLTGKQFVYYEDMPAEKIQDFDTEKDAMMQKELAGVKDADAIKAIQDKYNDFILPKWIADRLGAKPGDNPSGGGHEHGK